MRTFDPGVEIRRRTRRRTAAMWAAIAISLAIVVVLLGTSRGDSAWSIGALFLILGCLAVCTWAGVSAQHDIDHLVERAKHFVAQHDTQHDAMTSAARHPRLEGSEEAPTRGDAT